MWGSSGFHFGTCFVLPLFASMISKDVKTYYFLQLLIMGCKLYVLLVYFWLHVYVYFCYSHVQHFGVFESALEIKMN